jgi:RhtB (resistance to homoserine/threonine) family protein
MKERGDSMFGIMNFEVFLLAAILLNLTPGTDTMYIVSRSIAQGRTAGIYSALGISAGIVVHTFLAAFGLSVILMQSAFLFNLIKVAGAIYLAYLGIRMILAKNETKEQQSLPKQSNKKIFLQGMITNVTNPKVALFFLAFLPQFIQTNSGVPTPTPFIILGLTFTLTGGIWCLLTAYFSSMATSRLRGNSKVSTVLNRLTGIVFIAMGIKLLQTKQAS